MIKNCPSIHKLVSRDQKKLISRIFKLEKEIYPSRLVYFNVRSLDQIFFNKSVEKSTIIDLALGFSRLRSVFNSEAVIICSCGIKYNSEKSDIVPQYYLKSIISQKIASQNMIKVFWQ